MRLRVTGAGGHAASLQIENGRAMRAAIGRAGVSAMKREGDGASPAGTYHLRACYWRPDRLPPPRTTLPTIAITPDTGWCDEPSHPMYNREVRLPFAASHECLWREDSMYDLIVPLGYNDDRITPGYGSAIFLHLASASYGPTQGCVALALEDLLEVLTRVHQSSSILVV